MEGLLPHTWAKAEKDSQDAEDAEKARKRKNVWRRVLKIATPLIRQGAEGLSLRAKRSNVPKPNKGDGFVALQKTQFYALNLRSLLLCGKILALS